MSKFELSLAKDYVPDWTIIDAVRELFQNALDQQTTVEDNKMFFTYDESNAILYIGNKKSILDTKTLLIGSSTKRGESSTIGQFGEGYKIATLVLTRLKKEVVFYNYGKREVWKPRFVKSKRYGGEEVLTFFVDKKYVWQSVPDNNLTISITNVTQEEYKEIVESNLHLQIDYKRVVNTYGEILLDEDQKGKTYINGLFICEHKPFQYGYNFKPQYIRLDRDRSLARSIDLEWLSSQMWSMSGSKLIHEMIVKGSADVHYISSSSSLEDSYKDVSNETYENFKKNHGSDAVPVTTQEEYIEIAQNTNSKPVYVNNTYCSLIRSSSKYQPPEPKEVKLTTKQRLEKWLEANIQCLSKKGRYELQKIIDDLVL